MLNPFRFFYRLWKLRNIGRDYRLILSKYNNPPVQIVHECDHYPSTIKTVAETDREFNVDSIFIIMTKHLDKIDWETLKGFRVGLHYTGNEDEAEKLREFVNVDWISGHKHYSNFGRLVGYAHRNNIKNVIVGNPYNFREWAGMTIYEKVFTDINSCGNVVEGFINARKKVKKGLYSFHTDYFLISRVLQS